MLATAIADVLIGDDHPAVLRGLGDHPLEQATVRLLDVRLPPQLRLGVAQAQRECVAYPLQLAGRQHPRTAHGTDLPLEAPTRKGRREELAQPPLEVADLAAQVGAGQAVGALGDIDPGRERRRPVDLIEQFGQGTLLPARRLRNRF